MGEPTRPSPSPVEPAKAAKDAGPKSASPAAQSQPGQNRQPISLSPEEYERLIGQARQAEHFLRSMADLENTKKRLQREQEELSRYAAEVVVRELLPIMDSLGQALIAVDQQSDPQAIVKGVHLIYRQLLGLLEKEGVKRIPTVGERFDPHRHEAVAQVDAGNHQADGAVIEELQAGYTMHGKVIRPALVKVAKTSAGRDQRLADHEHTEQG